MGDQHASLFGDMPRQPHPAALVTWCSYPSAEGVPPAADCLTWRKGRVKAPADCGACLFRDERKPHDP